MNVIETENLVKTYKRYRKKEGMLGSIQGLFRREYEEKNAVNSVSLTVREGEVLGLRHPAHVQEIYGISEEEYRKRLKYFTELFGVEELMNMQVRTLSLGERMKMELIAALLHNPGILFLDEPTIGLDAVASRQIRGFLKEVKMLCSRSVVVNHGVKIYDGGTKELFEKYQKNKKITVVFEHAYERDTQSIHLIPGVSLLESTPYKKVMRVEKENTTRVLREIMKEMPGDISVEEEEIGVIVERIYKEGEAYA